VEGQQFLYLQPQIEEFGELAESPHSGVKVVYPARGGKCGGLEMYFVYILKSVKSNRHYIGCASNLNRRLAEHNDGKVKSTKAFMPGTIVYSEKYASRSEAYTRERKIKSYKGGIAFKELIKNSESWQSG
jgi:putative endonuclease